ncbi:MAG: hypothetical protein ABW185_11550 [Sedimenticola sp.]
MITQYVKQIKEEQAKARVLPRQAKPMFLSKVKSVSQYIMSQLQRSDISVREKFVLARDQALFKLQFFAGDRASDISNILTQELKELPDKSGFVFQHTFGKTLRGDRNINTFVVKRCADEHICPIRGLELYFSRARSWSVDLSNGYLFRPVLDGGLVLNDVLTYSSIYDRLIKYLTTLGIYDGETPHSMRAGCAISMTMTSDNASQSGVMQHIGWKSPRSMDYYSRATLIRDASHVASALADSVPDNKKVEQFFNENSSFSSLTPAFNK